MFPPESLVNHLSILLKAHRPLRPARFRWTYLAKVKPGNPSRQAQFVRLSPKIWHVEIFHDNNHGFSLLTIWASVVLSSRKLMAAFGQKRIKKII